MGMSSLRVSFSNKDGNCRLPRIKSAHSRKSSVFHYPERCADWMVNGVLQIMPSRALLRDLHGSNPGIPSYPYREQAF